ncbi:MAG: hypothetical protein B7Y35_07585 [Sphingomonadales bacterium 28-64-96]|nr:MAG: hypothetical protein B7Y35_07585 [Sphingomonadales bacterium 28-64-96]
MRGLLRAFTAATVGLMAASMSMAQPVPDPQLLRVHDEYLLWQRANKDDYSAATMASQAAGLAALQRRLTAIPVAGWSREAKVDWLVVRSAMDRSEYMLKVTRPWARDPGFYLEPLQRLAFTPLPNPALAARLKAVPASLSAARPNLTAMASDHVDLAIRSLDQSDGVEDGYPQRGVPPAGLIGWYQDLRARAVREQPELVPDIDRAIVALTGWRDWLKSVRPGINARAGVGKAQLDWYLRHALQMPYDSDAARTLGQRELERMWSFLAIAEHKNRAVPAINMAGNDADYRQRVADTDARIRKFLVSSDFMTIPAGIPPTLSGMAVPPTYLEPYNVPFIRRATPPNYWEQIQYRDPSPDHLHAVIPGHRMDLMLSNAHPDPIRRAFVDGARWQGWAVYLEEAALQAGFFDDRPRVKELIYHFGLWRAARTVGDIENQRNEKTAAEVANWWRKVTPFLDADVARKYAHIRTLPGHGLEYTIGNVQMWELLAAARHKQGERFNLRNFHDDFIRRGRIPMALIRYEMLGDDTMEHALFARPPIPE